MTNSAASRNRKLRACTRLITSTRLILSMPDWRGELSGLTFRIMRNLLRLLKHSTILHHKIYFFQRIHVGQRIA